MTKRIATIRRTTTPLEMEKKDKFTFLKEYLGRRVDRVLEVGCGSSGELTKFLATVGGKVTAVDISEEAVESVKKKLESIDNVDVYVADAQELKFPSQSFDAIVSYRTLHFVRDVPAFAKEADRLLKPGGKLIVISSPLAELKKIPGEQGDDKEIQRVFTDFYSNTFAKELIKYWDNKVMENFSMYCDPERENKNYLEKYSSRREKHVFEQVLHLLDLEEHLEQYQVCKKFVTINGREAFRQKNLVLQEKLLQILGRKVEDMYFEETNLLVCTAFYVETSVKST